MLSDGPFFCTEPSAPPSDITGDHISSTSIVVQWNEVPQEHRNGEIQGYRVLYSDADGREKKKTVDAPTRETSLIGLKKSTVYTIKVLAFTRVGDGPVTLEMSLHVGSLAKQNEVYEGAIQEKRVNKVSIHQCEVFIFSSRSGAKP